MKKLFVNTFFGIFLIYATTSYAQDYLSHDIQNYFEEINVSDGLSTSHVNAIAKDTAGFIWIGTEFGLNRYDGNSIKIFNADIGNPTSISTNLIYDIISDPYGDIWIATIDGLNKYQHLTDDFKVYKDKDTRNIYSAIIYDNPDKRIWIAANFGGLKYLDLEKDSLINCPLKIEPISINVFENQLFIGTKNDGVVIVNKYTFEVLKTIDPYVNSPILDIAVLKNEVWVATTKGGLMKFSLNNWENTTYFNKTNSDFKADGALSLAEDKNGNLLIGTDGNGLYVYDQTKFYQIVERPNLNSLKSNTIRDIFVDNENNIWLGTYASGINMHPAQNRSIANYQNDYTSKNSLSKSFVLAIEEDKNKKLFIGTNRGGLNILEKNNITRVEIPGTVVLSLCQDKTERLWIGTYQNGIYIYENGNLTNLSDLINNPIFNTMSGWSIVQGPEDNIWIGLTQFLVKLSVKDYSYKIYTTIENDTTSLINSTIRKLMWDENNHLWVGTIKGLSIYSLKEDKFISSQAVSHLSTKLITSIASTTDQTFVGTNGDGVFVYNDNMEIIDSLSSKHNGLVHNLVLELVNDGRGNIWVATSNGVSKVNASTLKVENFSSSDGFIGNTFNPRASKLLSSGHLALGSSHGLSIFNPDSIKYKKVAPKTLLTGLKVLNEEIQIDSTILTNSITYAKSITLSPELYSFSIDYVGLNYNNPDKVFYKYMLEGFENEWQTVDNKQTATFTNLKPGNYTFKVMASNGNNLWTKNPASIPITILPHWWETTFARISLFILLISIPILIIRIRTSTLTIQKKHLETQVKERTLKLENAYQKLTLFNSQLETRVTERTQKLEKSNKELDRFVYSASHDLSAPLKSIIGLLNLVRIDKSEDVSDYIDKIENNIKKLEDVIQNLIQFSRNSRQKVRKENIDLKLISNELQEELIYAESELSKNNINFTLDVKDDFKLTTDPVRLKIILSNIISNAMKYRKGNTKCKIHISGYIKGNKVYISVKDNGIGIEAEYLDKIFQMFYRATTLSKGSGLGLYIVKESAEKIDAIVSVTSTPKKGSTFTISFPVIS